MVLWWCGFVVDNRFILSKFKLDKTAYSEGKVEDQPLPGSYWRDRTVQERLAASWFLTCQAYNLDLNKVHRLDKTVFRIRSRAGE